MENIGESSFEFPSIWHDDVRANALFAPFRPKIINPVGWEAKMKTWQTLIDNWCTHHRQALFTVSDLKKNFIRDGKVPACLLDVINELQRENAIQTLESLETSLLIDNWTSWVVENFLKWPLKWGVDRVKASLSTGPNPETVMYCHLKVLEKLAFDLYHSIAVDLKGKLIDIETALNQPLNKETYLQLLWLQRNKLVQLTNSDSVGGQLAKFAKSDKEPLTISEKDLGIFSLERSEKRLLQDIKVLEEEKNGALEKARLSVREGKKVMGKTWLIRKNAIEKQIEKRAAALMNIQNMLDQLNQVESDSLVLKSYQIGASAFKKALESNGLNEDVVHKTMDEVESMLDVHKDLEEILARPFDDTSNTELEEELKELILDNDKASEATNLDIHGLPTVPDSKLEQKIEKQLYALKNGGVM